MIIGILKEKGTEKRVAMLPGEVAALKKMALDVIVEKGAGEKAFASDEAYLNSGAELRERNEVISGSAMVISVAAPVDDIDLFREGQIICSVLNPVENREWLESAQIGRAHV